MSALSIKYFAGLTYHSAPRISHWLISRCCDRYEALPPFLRKSILLMLDIITDTVPVQTGIPMFKNFKAHLLEFAISLESAATWKPSADAIAWESELNKIPKLKRVYMNMIDLIMEGADSQQCVIEWLAECIAMFDALANRSNSSKKILVVQ